MVSKRRKRTFAAEAKRVAQAEPRVADGYPRLVVYHRLGGVQKRFVTFTTDPQEVREGTVGSLRLLDPDPEAGDRMTPLRQEAVAKAAVAWEALLGRRVFVMLTPYDRPAAPQLH